MGIELIKQQNIEKITPIKSRDETIDLYYKNPNICKFCGKIITIWNDENISNVRKKNFAIVHVVLVLTMLLERQIEN